MARRGPDISVDLAGYCRPDEAKTSTLMHPNVKLNRALELLTK
ncbi:hypothetical protein [Glutamicibacter sp. NPDC127525]